jgi:hypothetical protein
MEKCWQTPVLCCLFESRWFYDVFFERKPHVLSNCLMALDPNHGQMLTFHADIAPLSRPRSLWRSDWVRLHLSRGFTGYHETTVVVSDEFLTLTVAIETGHTNG